MSGCPRPKTAWLLVCEGPASGWRGVARPGAADSWEARPGSCLLLSEQLPGPGLRYWGQNSRGSVARETLGSCELWHQSQGLSCQQQWTRSSDECSAASVRTQQCRDTPLEVSQQSSQRNVRLSKTDNCTVRLSESRWLWVSCDRGQWLSLYWSIEAGGLWGRPAPGLTARFNIWGSLCFLRLCYLQARHPTYLTLGQIKTQTWKSGLRTYQL